MNCMFCYSENFEHLDDVIDHQTLVDNNGKPICTALRESKARISSDIFELNPLVVGNKYAPKDHDGMFIVYTSDGQLMKDPKKIGINRLVKHRLNSYPLTRN